jgi:hypothetical protein
VLLRKHTNKYRIELNLLYNYYYYYYYYYYYIHVKTSTEDGGSRFLRNVGSDIPDYRTDYISLNLSYITSNSRIVAIFIIISLQAIFHT